jgi:outer membrane biosynthesis protein TonB
VRYSRLTVALAREEILKQVSESIDAAEERAAEIEGNARKKADALLADAQAEAKRLVARAQAAVAGLAAELTGEVPHTAPVPEPTPDPVPGPEPPAAPEPTPDPVPEPTPLPEQPSEEPPGEPPPAAEVSNGDDSGARLVAMKMALDGSSRDEVARRLAESHGIANSKALLDDVFARVSS